MNGRLGVFPFSSGIFSSAATDSSISIQIGTNLNIELSTTGSLTITALQGLSELVCGACGNFNDDASDDLISPTGNSVSNVVELVTSWSALDFNSWWVHLYEQCFKNYFWLPMSIEMVKKWEFKKSWNCQVIVLGFWILCKMLPVIRVHDERPMWILNSMIFW